MIAWQSDDMNWASWVAPVEPLVERWTMPWVLQGSKAGAIRSTLMVEVEDDENISVSRHIRFEKKAGVASINRVTRTFFANAIILILLRDITTLLNLICLIRLYTELN